MEIIEQLKKAPGSTAKELGSDANEMTKLEKAGKVVRVGTRKTGTQGKPPVEYAVPGKQANAILAVQVRETEAKKVEKTKVEKAKVDVLPVEIEGPAIVEYEKTPHLPNIEDVRGSLSEEHKPQIAYIEGVFARGGREMADYSLLRKRYLDIANYTRRSFGTSVTYEEEI